jgi:glutamine amidotransferase PdxT
MLGTKHLELLSLTVRRAHYGRVEMSENKWIPS